MLAHLGVILGSSWDDLGHNFRSAWRQGGNNMDPNWCQDAPSWHLNGHLDAIWGAILLILGILGAIFTKIAKVKNRMTVQRFCYIFWVLEGLVGRSWTLFWAILATSSAILRHLGLKLEISGQVVGTKMATLRQDGHLDSILVPSWLDFSRQGV